MNEHQVELTGDGQLWTTTEVAAASGVSSRTLRHYDEIGLLTPTGVGSGGVRNYDRRALLRLQQILLLRELDLSLNEIQLIIDGQRDLVHALREHRERLADATERLQRIAATVDSTIIDLEGERTMSAAEIFDGFDPQKQSQYETELVESGSPDVQRHIDESWRRIGLMSKDDARAINEAYVEVETGLAVRLRAGAPADDPQVQELIDAHYAIVCRFWTPDAQAYAGLGELYVNHEDFRARYDALDARLAQFMSDAMAVYALERLA